MKTLLLHCKNIEMEITGLSTRPTGIVHSKIKEKEQKTSDCILVFVTIESDDTIEKTNSLVSEILKFSQDTGHKNIFVSPFAHLSNNLAKAKDALTLFSKIIESLNNTKGLNIIEGHFGSDKELQLHLFGHPGAVRFREF